MLIRLNNHKLKLKWSKISEVYLGFMCTYVLGDSAPPLTPPLGLYTRTLFVSQDRRHLFVTPCPQPNAGSVWLSILN
jgi:hypothetical protein